MALASTCRQCISFATILFIRCFYHETQLVAAFILNFLLQRCLGDSDKVCPVCERANRKVLIRSQRAPAISEAYQVFEMKKSLEIPGDLHEQFFRCNALLQHQAAFRSLRLLTGISKAHPTALKPCQIFLEEVSSRRIDHISKN